MSAAKITTIGFYNYLRSLDDDLFKYLTLPAGIDKDVVANNILLRGGEFEVLYSDPYFMQASIDIWSKKWFTVFEKWLEALNVEYDPLDNYNRYEDYTDTSTGKDTHTASGSIDTTTSNDTKTVDDSSSEVEHKVSAYDSSAYQPKDIETTDYDNTTTFESDGTNKTTTSDSKTIETGSKFEHHSHMHGNIGVTTSQQMLQAELDVRRFNLYNEITDIFLREYTIPIY